MTKRQTVEKEKTVEEERQASYREALVEKEKTVEEERQTSYREALVEKEKTVEEERQTSYREALKERDIPAPDENVEVHPPRVSEVTRAVVMILSVLSVCAAALSAIYLYLWGRHGNGSSAGAEAFMIVGVFSTLAACVTTLLKIYFDRPLW